MHAHVVRPNYERIGANDTDQVLGQTAVTASNLYDMRALAVQRMPGPVPEKLHDARDIRQLLNRLATERMRQTIRCHVRGRADLVRGRKLSQVAVKKLWLDGLDAPQKNRPKVCSAVELFAVH